VKVKIREICSEGFYHEEECGVLFTGEGVALYWIKVDEDGSLIVTTCVKCKIENTGFNIWLEAPKEDSNGLG